MFLLSRVTDSLVAGSFAAVCRLAAGGEDPSPAQVHVGHHLGSKCHYSYWGIGDPIRINGITMATGHRQVLQRPLLQRGTQGPRRSER